MSYIIDPDEGTSTGPCAVYGDAIFLARCPHCGRFAQIPEHALVPEDGAASAQGVCRKHGPVDLTFAGWASDFDREDYGGSQACLPTAI